MSGSFFGGLLALLYFLIFQICGIVLASCFFKQERFYKRMVIGSAAGSVLLMWLPVLCAFLFDFTVLSHILAAVLLLVLTGLAVLWTRPVLLPTGQSISAFLHREWTLVIPFALWLIYAGLLLHSFRMVDGEIWSSQCTYGDMSMHFGFITSIAEQKTFPPEYSILPGTKLSYPFLSDSISSSLYLLGAPLQLAYFLPMLFAGGQVFFGAWLFFTGWLKDRAKSIFAMILFFLNGGFGFAYFLSDFADDYGNFTRIFTAFYETPTNLVDENIRWVNVIVDMMVPQRATLFGWAILFPLLYVLYRAVHEQKTAYFLPAAVLAGGVVMIHTHSFLALGLICGVWLLFSLLKTAGMLQAYVLRTAKRVAALLLLIPVAAGVLAVRVILRESVLWLILAVCAAAVFVLLMLFLLMIAIRKGGGKALLTTWGVFFGVVMLLALPQLFTWTFTQADADSFVRGWYNWANLSDSYLWFYLVNLGIAALFVLPALFTSGRRMFPVAAPAVAIWFLCEFVVFQPNDYDNNKLLYVAYLLLCGVTASYMVDLYRKLKGLPGRQVLAGFCVVLCTLSAVLTIGREAVAEYCLFGRGQRAAAQFVQDNTEPTATILTDQRHNNEIAALTGRNIVCGSTSYVYFHGLNYTERQDDMARMFQSPAKNLHLYEQYGVDYVMVSAYEINNFGANETAIATLFPCVYDQDGIRLYKVS